MKQFGLIVSDPSQDSALRQSISSLLSAQEIPFSGFTDAPAPLFADCPDTRAAFLFRAAYALMQPGQPLPADLLLRHLSGDAQPGNVIRKYTCLQLSFLPYLRPGRTIVPLDGGVRIGDDLLVLLSRLPGRVHLYPNRIVHAGNRSECDLVALCRRGATVIEVKNHAGTVTGDLSDHDLLLTRKNGTELTFYNPAMQVTTHAQTLARALAEAGVPCPVKGCVLFIREGTIVRLSDRFHRRRVTPVFTRRNRFRLRWYILHRGKRLRRREVRALRRILEDMK